MVEGTEVKSEDYPSAHVLLGSLPLLLGSLPVGVAQCLACSCAPGDLLGLSPSALIQPLLSSSLSFALCSGTWGTQVVSKKR